MSVSVHISSALFPVLCFQWMLLCTTMEWCITEKCVQCTNSDCYRD